MDPRPRELEQDAAYTGPWSVEKLRGLGRDELLAYDWTLLRLASKYARNDLEEFGRASKTLQNELEEMGPLRDKPISTECAKSLAAVAVRVRKALVVRLKKHTANGFDKQIKQRWEKRITSQDATFAQLTELLKSYESEDEDKNENELGANAGARMSARTARRYNLI